jgi:hypothetical protein
MHGKPMNLESRVAVLETKEESSSDRLEKIEGKIDRVLWAIAAMAILILLQLVLRQAGIEVPRH